MHFSVSAYKKDRPAVCAAILGAFGASAPEDAHGFLVFDADAAPEEVEKVVLAAGAHSVSSSGEAPPVAEARPAAVEAPAEVPAESAAESAAEAVPSEVSSLAVSFCARFPGTEGALAFARAAAGKVVFAEPPTGWDAGCFCVRGSSDPVVVAALAAEHGGSIDAPAVEVPAVEVPHRGRRRGW